VRVIFARTIFIQCIVVLGISLAPFKVLYASGPPSTVIGEYRGHGCATKVQTDCVPTQASDRVQIQKGQGAEALVKVKISFDRGHTCRIEGRATWSDDHFTLHADGLEPSQPCILELRVNGSELTIQDEEARCRQLYCGTRGTFDGTHFKKK
jgi:hypothetical protein